jgi:hypothetical protein
VFFVPLSYIKYYNSNIRRQANPCMCPYRSPVRANCVHYVDRVCVPHELVCSDSFMWVSTVERSTHTRMPSSTSSFRILRGDLGARSALPGAFESNFVRRADIPLRAERTGRAKTMPSKARESGSGSVSVRHERRGSSGVDANWGVSVREIKLWIGAHLVRIDG